jgi:hypothetical protein
MAECKKLASGYVVLGAFRALIWVKNRMEVRSGLSTINQN